MKMNLNIKEKILLFITFCVFLPFLIIFYLFFKNTLYLINQKFSNELVQKKHSILNFSKFQIRNLKKTLEQLSYSKEVIIIFNTASIYENFVNAETNLKLLIKNLGYDYGILFNSKKKKLVETKNIQFLEIPKKLLIYKLKIFYIEYKNQFYLVGTSPLYIGTIERSVYGYILIAKKIDKKFLNEFKDIFDLKSLTISNYPQKNYDFNLLIGETITGKPIYLNGNVKKNFYNKVKKQYIIIFLILIIGAILMCILISYLISAFILRPLNYVDSTLENVLAKGMSAKEINYTKNDEIAKIINKINSILTKSKNIFNKILNYLVQEKTTIDTMNEDLDLLKANEKSLKEKNIKIQENCSEVNNQINEIKKINIHFINQYEMISNYFQTILKLYWIVLI